MDVILDNDMAGERVWTDGESPNVVTKLPSVFPECLEVVPACSHMHAMSPPACQIPQKGIHDAVVLFNIREPCKGEEWLETDDAIFEIVLMFLKM